MRRNRFHSIMSILQPQSCQSPANSEINSRKVTANITTGITQIIYLYGPQNLNVACSIAVLCSALAAILGGYALYANGITHDASVSAFGVTLQDGEVGEYIGQDSSDAQALDRSWEKPRLRFRVPTFDAEFSQPALILFCTTATTSEVQI